MYVLRMPIGAPPQLAAKYDGDQRTPFQFCLEIGADLGKDGAKSVDSISVQHPMSILCHEDQVNMKLENAMSTMSNVT